MSASTGWAVAPGLLTVAGHQAWSRVTRQVPGPTVLRLTALTFCCSVNTGTVAAREMRADTVNGCTLTPQISAVPATDRPHYKPLSSSSDCRCRVLRGVRRCGEGKLLHWFHCFLFSSPACPPPHLAPPRALALYQLTRIHFRLRLRHKSVTSRNLSLLCLHNDPKH